MRFYDFWHVQTWFSGHILFDCVCLRLDSMGTGEVEVGVAVSASFSCDRTQKYLYEIKLMAFVDVLLIYTMSRKGRQEAKVGGVW